MSNLDKNNSIISIEKEIKKSYLDYAMSVIISRALPDVRDGLKPVHRRILYAMNILGNYYNKSYKKSARIVGDVIGKYHPHGDSSVYDAIVRMTQDFSLRYPLIDGQGNFGSIDGDSAAAMRYTEIRMSKISDEILADLEYNTVDFIPNYDNTEYIPDVMPSKIPNLLINGSYGIAVGVATNIPPHNISEVIDACLAIINNNNISLENLIKYIPGPDFPTYGEIHGKNDIIQVYRTGKGKICIKSKIEIEIDLKNNIEFIIISELPYQINKSKLIEKIAELIKTKKITGINDLRDESDKEGIRIVIEVKKDALSKIIINNLYKKTSLQISLGINMIALKEGKPKVLSLKEILNSFIDHRKDIISKKTIFLLKANIEKIHVLEGLIIAIDNIDKIIKIIKKSNNINEAKNKLINENWKLNSDFIKIKEKNKDLLINNNIYKNDLFKTNEIKLTEKQIQSILDLRLYKLTNLEYKNIVYNYNNILTKIKEYNWILKDIKNLMEIIKEELKEIKNKYKDKRKTKIISEKSDIITENLIDKVDVVITLSHKGYIKFQPISNYKIQKRGGKGKFATKIKEEDFVYILLVANTHDDILLFSNKGIVYKIKVYQLPESSRNSKGKLISNIISIKKEEKITTILPIKSDLDINNNYYVCIATLYGFIKKTLLLEFKKIKNTGIIAIKLNKNDELICAEITHGNNNIMIFSENGRVVRFLENQVRSIGRVSYGVKGISLYKDDKVASILIPKKENQILTITSKGFGKRTEQIEYPIKSRSNKGVISIKTNKKNGKVIKAISVDKNDEVLIITNSGILVRIKVSEISLISRNTKGIILIKLSNNEYVVGIQKIFN